jgi:hypothetical protein
MSLPHDIVDRFGSELLGERRARFDSKEVSHVACSVWPMYRRHSGLRVRFTARGRTRRCRGVEISDSAQLRPEFAGSWILRVSDRLKLLERPRIYASSLRRDVLVDFLELLLQLLSGRAFRQRFSRTSDFDSSVSEGTHASSTPLLQL